MTTDVTAYQSTAEVTMCRFAGFAARAAWMAALLLSVPQLVKTISRDAPPMSAATCARASSVAWLH